MHFVISNPKQQNIILDAKATEMWYNSLGKYQIQGRRKEQLYTKDKTALNVILSDCTRPRTFSQYVYGGSIFHS